MEIKDPGKYDILPPEEKATQLLKESKITHAPVDVEVIASMQNVNVAEDDFDGDDQLSGMLYRDDSSQEVIIVVNEGHSENRRRFTIAHELGHFKLDHGNLFIDKTNGMTVAKINFRNHVSGMATDEKEIDANRFAAALLMPRNFIAKEISNLLNANAVSNGSQLIEQMALKFKVSQQAMTIRLTKLGYIENEDLQFSS